MNATLLIQICEGSRSSFSQECPTPLLLGRQVHTEEPLYSLTPTSHDAHRLVIARFEEATISRWHVRLELISPDRVRVENLSKTAVLDLDEGKALPPGGTACVLPFPVTLRFGPRTIFVQTSTPPAPDEGMLLQSLASPIPAPLRRELPGTSLESLGLSSRQNLDPEKLVRWLQTAMGVLHSAATNSEFFQKAAQAVVEIVGMDAGRVLTREDGSWKTVAYHTASETGGTRGGPPSQRVLSQVSQELRTFWMTPDPELGGSSLAGVNSVIAAPVLDSEGNAIAALYAERYTQARQGAEPSVSKLDAILLDLLAGAVAAGLARLEHEREAVRLQTQFEQFFTPDLAQELATHPELLVGRDQEISVLFCDIRGFSRLSHKLGPAGTLEMINDVMLALSDCVLARRGVLVDYIGDELMAMWGAPRPEPDHAWQACQAALDMLATLPKLNERWRPILGEPVDVGIGINTGVARVGNVGSDRKFKYGPLGDTVNVASRVQGANKYYRTRILATRACHERLPPGVSCRRLGSVRAVNLAEPIELFELGQPKSDSWADLKDRYETALGHFEAQRFREAANTLGNLITAYPNDGPSIVLMARAASALIDEPLSFDPSFPLPGK